MVASTNLYWTGMKHGQLDRNNVPASWLRDSHLAERLAVSNKAFCILFHARQTLEMQSSEYKTVMKDALEDCARAGWGVGVDDMEDACDQGVSSD